MSKQDYKNYFDVVILPPKEVRDYCISLSRKFYKHGADWQLGVKNYKPHLSLYHIKVKPNKVDTFLQDLEQVVQSHKPGKLKLAHFENIHGLILTTDKPIWLNKFYLKVIKGTIHHFDFKYGAKKLWNLKSSGAVFEKNILKYGTPMVGRYFNPHFTLNVFKGKKPAEEFFDQVEKLKVKKLSFIPDAIYVCQLGTSHTCHKIIKKINFK